MDAVPFLSAKVVRGLWLFSSKALNNSSQGPKPLGLSGKSPHLRVVFSAKTLCKPAPLPLFCYKKDELLRALPEKSAYSDLWTHKKNVAMDKQKGTQRGRLKGKPNTTSSMKEKGYSSSSHYRINPTAEKSEQVLAIKFVQWDVLPWRAFVAVKYISYE